MAVPEELDHVELTLTGPTMEQPLAPLNLTGADSPAFPRTLALLGNGSSPVTIKAVGLRLAAPVVTDTVRTHFVDGEKLMVRLVLTAACVGVMCPADQTCSDGKCLAIDRDGSSLPSWPGTPPPRPGLGGQTIGGRTLWAGGWRSCATQGQNLYCWGENDAGQLGDGNINAFVSRVPVVDLATFPVSVALGFKHTCICDRNGQAWCWGLNSDGQLGVPSTGSNDVQLEPVAVPTVTDCVQITAGYWHTCAIRGNRTISCWGRNSNGQLGQPTTTVMSTPVPQVVAGFADVIEVKAGEKFNCGRNPTAVVCWGDNFFGELGDGTTTSRSMPVKVNLPGGSAELATGRHFACVRTGGGQVSCWGENSDELIGSASASAVTTPTLIAQLDDAVQIAAGHRHACALRASRVVSCWGSNQFAQLGAGPGTNSAVPVDVTDLRDVTEVVAGVVHSCARHASGAVSCWGQNIASQLGDGTIAERILPVGVVGFF